MGYVTSEKYLKYQLSNTSDKYWQVQFNMIITGIVERENSAVFNLHPEVQNRTLLFYFYFMGLFVSSWSLKAVEKLFK